MNIAEAIAAAGRLERSVRITVLLVLLVLAGTIVNSAAIAVLIARR